MKPMNLKYFLAWMITAAVLLSGFGCARTLRADTAAKKTANPAVEIVTVDMMPAADGNDQPAAAEAVPAPVAIPNFPERYEKQLSFDGLEVQIDAEVVVPPLTAYPTYVLEPMRFTQEQADRMIAALLGGAELYDESNSYNRKYIQGLIDYYAEEIKACTDDPEVEGLIPTYESYIARLRKEYETAPEDSTYTPASRTLLPKDTQVARMLYGTKKVHEDGGISYEWSKDAARRAAADGYGAISGVCRQPDGRKMFLLLENTSGTRITFAPPDDAGTPSAGADFTQAEAEARGAALMEAMGLDVELVSIRRYAPTGVSPSYILRYRTAAAGTAGADITPLYCFTSSNDFNVAMRSMVPEEQVYLSLDNEGVYRFSWDNPVRVKGVEQESVSLCKWKYIAEIIDKMFGVKHFWQFDTDRDDPMIIGRRIEVSSIQLSYMQVMRGNDFSERSYVPVWDVCGRLVYCYDTQYSAENGGWLVDENHERVAVAGGGEEEICSLLTINAIDGTIIDRQ